MSRWRDVRHNKILPKEKKPLSFVISPPANRIKAFITDSFMLLMPILYLIFYVVMGSREEFAKHMLLGWIYILVPHFLIIIGFWYFKSQTPGYKAYDIKLVNNDLNKPTIIQLVIRYFTFLLSLLLVGSLFFAIFRKDKKALHDILSGTIPLQIDK